MTETQTWFLLVTAALFFLGFITLMIRTADKL